MRTFKPEEILNKKSKKSIKSKKSKKRVRKPNPPEIALDNNTKRKIMLYGVSVFSVIVLLVNFISISAKAKASEDNSKIASAKMLQKVYAAAISVDGKNLAYLQDEAAANAVLSKVKQESLPSDENMEVQKLYFKQQVDIKKTWVDKKNIEDVDSVVKKLLYGTQDVRKYIVKEGDNLWLLARKNDMRVKDILAANPGLDEEKLSIGQEIFFKKPRPQITVVAVLKGERKKIIPYDTKIVKDTSMKRGTEKVVTEGENGLRIYTYQLTTVNGTVTDKAILADRIAQKPVTKVIKSGSARSTRLIASRSGDGGGSGDMLWPTSSRRISSSYGYRGREFHTGLDIDGSMGDAVVAADAGTVIMTGWNGGYGKTVVIDHGNGVLTRYAHLSSYSVSEGEKVGRGEYIGGMGSSGRSTGSHLHFEVIVNGAAQNPKRYIN